MDVWHIPLVPPLEYIGIYQILEGIRDRYKYLNNWLSESVRDHRM